MSRVDTTRRRRDERGFTLIEVMVGMTLMSVFLAIFGGALISMIKSVSRTQQTAYAQSSVNQAFIRLESQIRYASGISLPATNVFTTGDAVVEFATDFSGDSMCTQLRLSPTGALQQRTWVQPSSGGNVVMGATLVLAADIDDATPTATAGADTTVAGPFAMVKATGLANTQRLEIAITAKDPSAATPRVRKIDVTFSALNTGTSTESTSVCSAGRDKVKYPWPAG